MGRKTNTKNEKLLLRTAIYIRVSTDKQAKDGDSVRDQLATTQRYIDNHENMVLVDTYIDDGISGQKLTRNDFQRLIDDVYAHKIDLIVFTRLDRWFRNLRHYLNTQDILDHNNVEWIATEQPYFDTTTPHGRAFVNNSMIWAELEAQNDSDRIISVFDDKVANGEVISGATPLGYSIVNKHLVPNDDAPKVVAMYEFYRKCGNIRKTIQYMESEFGLVRSFNSVKNALTNKKYIGEFRENKNYCEPLVDKELFYDVQRLIEINIKVGKRYDYIFSGLIKCEDCNHTISGCQQLGKKKYLPDGTYTKYRYTGYRCQQGVILHRCPNHKFINERYIENTLLERIRPELENYVSQYDVANMPVIKAGAKRRNIENKIQKLKELYLNDLITLDEFKIDKEKFQAQLEELDDDKMDPIKDVTALKKFLKIDFESMYSSFTTEEKRELWRSVIKEIRIDHNKKIRIIFL